MTKLQKYLRKIIKAKNKLKKRLTKIGISYTEQFELKDTQIKELILPCHLGILFFSEFSKPLFNKIKFYLNQVFDSFFFDIKCIGEYNLSNELFSRGVKKEYKEIKKSSGKMKIHPTNKFFQILINKRIEEKLGMIIAITNLPLYSSSDDNIIFLFGEAHLKHRCCVVSSLKLKEDFYNRPENKNIFEERIIKEIIHEIGHLILSPGHCYDYSCVMRFSQEIQDIDQKSYDFCNNCKSKLIQIRKAYNI
jgi:predicted Zn-dependent protease